MTDLLWKTLVEWTSGTPRNTRDIENGKDTCNGVVDFCLNLRLGGDLKGEELKLSICG